MQKQAIDFGTPKQKALEKALHEYITKSEETKYTETWLYCGMTINIHFYGITDFGEEQVAELDFLSKTKVFFWVNQDEYSLEKPIKKIIEEHSYTIETNFKKLSVEEKAQLGYEE